MTYKTFLGSLAGAAALAISASPAHAASVSVEIEGKTVVKAPAVVQTAASATKPGGASCTGAVPSTALETAVAGDWDGPGFGVTRIQGEVHLFAANTSSWAVYVNGRFIDDTACDHPLADGDKVLFWWTNAYAPDGYDEPVLLDAPATAVPGQAFTVKASQVDTTFNPNPPYDSNSVITPAAGATVNGGTAAATTGADGSASVTVGAGPYTLVVTKGNRAPARVAGCATTGSDGFCGTTKPGGPPATTPAARCVTNGHDGFCGTADTFPAYGRLLGITEGKKYKKGQGPRQLAGAVEPDASGLKDVRLRLTRRNADACSTYDGRTEKLKAMKKCGAVHGVWFSVGAKADFTYLLPSRLGRGRYVLDVQVVDRAGNTTTQLARGTSRVVFTVA